MHGKSIFYGDEIQSDITKTIETHREELTTGSTFARRYQIIEELGKGGMGKVYRVLDTKLDEEVALKLIMPDIASDKNTIERFKNELKLARKITQNPGTQRRWIFGLISVWRTWQRLMQP